MSDVNRLIGALKKADALAQQGDKQAAQDARQLSEALKKIRDGGQTEKYPLMSQLNTGIASAAGGLVDFLNPFDKPHALNPLPQGTGSAVTGLRNMMNTAGIETTDKEPQNSVQAFARGTGEAAGALLPVAKGVQMARSAGGVLGNISDDVYTALATRGGALADVFAGGVSRASGQLAAEAGAPEWVQQTAEIATPMAAGAALVGAGNALKYSPARMAYNKALETVAPYTEAGAMRVAGQRIRDLAGGSYRAQDLADTITADNPLNLTPAQQTQDPNLLALERSAADLDPNLRSELDARRVASEETAKRTISQQGGETADAQDFFAKNRLEFKSQMESQAQAAQDEALAKVREIGGNRTESENSLIVSRAVKNNLENQLLKEKQLWAEVPRGAQVGTSNSKDVAQRLIDETPFAQRKDIPQSVRDLLDSPEVYGEAATVKEMHGLYSELRRVARSAMAGNDQNKNMARIANEVADSILADLGAKAGDTVIGRQINEARAFSSALHETFDRGAPGRILKRTLDGDTAIDPELSLRRTVGRAGAEGMVSARQLESAGGDPVRRATEDYLRAQFSTAATKPGVDEVNLSSARAWMRQNDELLAQFPDLKKEFGDSISQKMSADSATQRTQGRVSALSDPSKSSVAAFTAAQPERAINAITSAKDPVQAARKIAAEASRDPSGDALAGVKGSITDHLVASALKATGQQGFSASALGKIIDEPKFSKAMSVIFSPFEMRNIRQMATELKKAQYGQADSLGGNLSGAEANSIISVAARIAGANYGASLGGSGGASIQTANIMSNRVRGLVDRLASDKASQMLADAVTDPELMKALLNANNPKFEELAVRKILPYVTGTASATMPGIMSTMAPQEISDIVQENPPFTSIMGTGQ